MSGLIFLYFTSNTCELKPFKTYENEKFSLLLGLVFLVMSCNSEPKNEVSNQSKSIQIETKVPENLLENEDLCACFRQSGSTFYQQRSRFIILKPMKIIILNMNFGDLIWQNVFLGYELFMMVKN